MRGLSVLVAVLFTSVASPGVGEEATPPPTQHPALAQWLPSESYPGGKQSDPRLGQPVRLWGAGVPLKQVFQSIHEQTGVEIGFWPPGDMNERVCVNLYLNPDKPPSLRELMAQLAWVTDCAFAWSKADVGCHYALLSTSMGESAVDDLRREAAEWNERKQAQRRNERTETKRAALAALEECGDALLLSREEVIGRYLGNNDPLLETILDERGRPALQYLLSLDPKELADTSFESDQGLSKRWGDLTAQQRAYLRAAFPYTNPECPYWSREPPVRGEACPQSPMMVEVGLADRGAPPAGMSVTLWYERGPAGAASGQEWDVGLAPDPREPLSTELAALRARRAIGEGVSDEAIGAAEHAQWAAYRERSQADDRRETRERFQRYRSLSPDGKRVLSGLALPLDWDAEYSLWQVQEELAASSGMHVVSDCFWQPQRTLTSRLNLLPQRTPPGMLSALDALTLMCGGEQERWVLLPGGPQEAGAVSWEWGDAGRFIRFRSRERSLWRAAFLPADVLAAFDALLEKALAGAQEHQELSQVEIAVHPRYLAGLTARVSRLQAQFGGKPIYGDPADPTTALRDALADGVLSALSEGYSWLSLLGRYDDEFWARLESEGIRNLDIALRGRAGRVRHYDVIRLLPPRMPWPAEFAAALPEDAADLSHAADTWVILTLNKGDVGMLSFPATIMLKPTALKLLREDEPVATSPSS